MRKTIVNTKVSVKLRKVENGNNSDISTEEASEIITQVYQFSRVS